MSLNEVILIGRLAHDPELKHMSAGVAISSFRLAVNRPRSANSTEEQADYPLKLENWRT
jgi:single-strand DNA-binding protein